MTLSEVLPSVVSVLEANPFFADLALVASGGPEYNTRVETALRDRGLCLVLMTTGATAPEPKAPRLRLHCEVMVSVLENPLQNTNGPDALRVVQEVLTTLHQAKWPNQRGVANELTVDTPAFETGPLDGGLVTFFCHFAVRTTHP